MWKNKNLPEFGCLNGVKIIHATNSTAGPFGVQLLADHGADVIWLENSKGYDLSRYINSYCTAVERRNQRNLAIDIPSPEGREVFLKLVKEADVFVEASKGGQYEKWGLSDEVLWEVNPRLVICHESGFGQTGLQEYVSRPCYDMIAQAFSGYTDMNMNPVTGPYPVGPYGADYMTGMFIAFSVSLALYKVAKTGVGESIDLAQIDIMLRSQQFGPDAVNGNMKPVQKAGDPSNLTGMECYQCKDDVWLQCALAGGGVVKKTCEFLGIEYGKDPIPKGTSIIVKNAMPEASALYEGAIKAYLSTKTAAEAEEEMLAFGLPVCKINKIQDVVNDPHVQARGIFVEHETIKGEKINWVGPVPKMKKAPGQVWGKAPYPGMNNEEILKDLGYSDDLIKDMYDKKVISNDSEMKSIFPYNKK